MNLSDNVVGYFGRTHAQVLMSTQRIITREIPTGPF